MSSTDDDARQETPAREVKLSSIEMAEHYLLGRDVTSIGVEGNCNEAFVQKRLRSLGVYPRPPGCSGLAKRPPGTPPHCPIPPDGKFPKQKPGEYKIASNFAAELQALGELHPTHAQFLNAASLFCKAAIEAVRQAETGPPLPSDDMKELLQLRQANHTLRRVADYRALHIEDIKREHEAEVNHLRSQLAQEKTNRFKLSDDLAALSIAAKRLTDNPLLTVTGSKSPPHPTRRSGDPECPPSPPKTSTS